MLDVLAAALRDAAAPLPVQAPDEGMTEVVLAAGIYRHYKGPHYLVLGLAHDANADTLADVTGLPAHTARLPLGEREVVVYVPLQLDSAHIGARMAVRTLGDFLAVVCAYPACPKYGEPIGYHPDACALNGHATRRFAFVGERWPG